MPNRYAFNANWEISASHLQSGVYNGTTPTYQYGYGSNAGEIGYANSLEDALMNTNINLNGFIVKNPDGTYTQYWYTSSPPSRPATLSHPTTERVPIYGYIDHPEEVIINKVMQPYIEHYNLYRYETGLQDLEAMSHFYTEVLIWSEQICFDGGIPFKVTLTTDEYLPTGSYINLWFIGKDNQLIPLLPEGREWTSEILQFKNEGTASLMFYPSGEIYIYRDEENILLPITGRTVDGTAANVGAMNTLGGTAWWVWYQGDKNKANFMPYTSRTATYYSEQGRFGELFDSIPFDKKLTLEETPYCDIDRLVDTTYTPVVVVIDGYQTLDTTNWEKKYEDLFPVEPLYVDHERVIHYKVRGKTIFFEETVDRPVRVFYEYIKQCGILLVQMGVVHKRADCPVLYSFTLSYI